MTGVQAEARPTDQAIGDTLHAQGAPRSRRTLGVFTSSTPFWPVARQLDVLRPLPFDTPLPLFAVWFRPSGRPRSGGIEG